MSKELIATLGLIASIILPVWNIPLIVKMVKRKSSVDVSLWWAVGVWSCFLLMLPSGLSSSDVVWKTFNITNFISFTFVMLAAVKYRNGPAQQ